MAPLLNRIQSDFTCFLDWNSLACTYIITLPHSFIQITFQDHPLNSDALEQRYLDQRRTWDFSLDVDQVDQDNAEEGSSDPKWLQVRGELHSQIQHLIKHFVLEAFSELNSDRELPIQLSFQFQTIDSVPTLIDRSSNPFYSNATIPNYLPSYTSSCRAVPSLGELPLIKPEQLEIQGYCTGNDGSGGVVFVRWGEALEQRRYVLKLLHPATHPDKANAFINEMRFLAKIKSTDQDDLTRGICGAPQGLLLLETKSDAAKTTRWITGYLLPFYEGGSLEEQLGAHLSVQTRLQWSLELTQALYRLHRVHHSFHGDFKPNNVLLRRVQPVGFAGTDPSELVLIDFEQTRTNPDGKGPETEGAFDAIMNEQGRLEYIPYNETLSGPRPIFPGEYRGWQAFQAWAGIPEAMERAEVWGLGVVLKGLLYGSRYVRYGQRIEWERDVEVEGGEENRIEVDPDQFKEWVEIVRQCLDVDPLQRPRLVEIKRLFQKLVDADQ